MYGNGVGLECSVAQGMHGRWMGVSCCIKAGRGAWGAQVFSASTQGAVAIWNGLHMYVLDCCTSAYPCAPSLRVMKSVLCSLVGLSSCWSWMTGQLRHNSEQTVRGGSHLGVTQ
jgi:hypothetical protein